jgi:hypothetical protein
VGDVEGDGASPGPWSGLLMLVLGDELGASVSTYRTDVFTREATSEYDSWNVIFLSFLAPKTTSPQ